MKRILFTSIAVALFPFFVQAHATLLGNLNVSIHDTTAELVFTLPVERTLDDEELFKQYSTETIQVVADGSGCPVSLVNFESGLPTTIHYEAACGSIQNDIQISTTLFSEEGYSYSTTVIRDDLVTSKILNDTDPSIQISFDEVSTTTEKDTLTWLKEFTWLGMKHIYSGYDHILFILALLLIIPPFKQTIKIISAFTIAHSITLILAGLAIVTISSRLVEPLIALTIAYVALEGYLFDLLKKKFPTLPVQTRSHRWHLAFGFGLIHGLGFASALKEITLPSHLFTQSLLSFNIGVEIGQLTIIAIIFPLLYLLKKTPHHERVLQAGTVVVSAVAIFWFLERIL